VKKKEIEVFIERLTDSQREFVIEYIGDNKKSDTSLDLDVKVAQFIMNNEWGKNFRKPTPELRARVREYNLVTVVMVIRYVVKKPFFIRRREYLRPSTIFNPGKFESYLNEDGLGHEDEARTIIAEAREELGAA
jgi:uncharacterized phage protein (TIGR02220 family)